MTLACFLESPGSVPAGGNTREPEGEQSGGVLGDGGGGRLAWAAEH